MLAIIAMISDLPAMIAAVVEKLTGADLSGIVQMSNEAIAKLLELADKIFRSAKPHPRLALDAGRGCCHFTAVKKRRGIFSMTEPFWREGKFAATVLRRSARNSSFSPLSSRSR